MINRLQFIIVIFFSLFLTAPSYGLGFQNTNNRDTQKIIDYLKQKDSGEKQVNEIKEIIGRSQALFLSYKKDTPADYTERHLQLMLQSVIEKTGAFATPISFHNEGKIYPQFEVAISSGGESKEKRWLSCMRLPVDSGYEIKSVRIVYIPSEEMKTTTAEKSKIIFADIENKLEKLKPKYKQLQEFNKDKVRIEKSVDKEWPGYPIISYRFDFGREIPGTKGGYEHATADWSEIKVWIEPVSARPHCLIHPMKGYPRQGIAVCWIVSSAKYDSDFNKEVSQTIANTLTPLDEYEKELDSKENK